MLSGFYISVIFFCLSGRIENSQKAFWGREEYFRELKKQTKIIVKLYFRNKEEYNFFLRYCSIRVIYSFIREMRIINIVEFSYFQSVKEMKISFFTQHKARGFCG